MILNDLQDRIAESLSTPPWWLPMILVGWYHVAMQRIRGLQAGSPSTHEQQASMLASTVVLDHRGIASISDTHSRDADGDHYVFQIAQHNMGDPREAKWCPPNTVANRKPQSYALIVGKPGENPGEEAQAAGHAHFVADVRIKRYACGTVRWATATADSVAGNSTTRVHPTVAIQDDELECDCTAEVSGTWGNPGIKSGDPVAYAIKYDGTPIVFAGGTAVLKEGTAQSAAREGATSVMVTNQAGGTDEVFLAETPATHTPNIDSGNTVVYGFTDAGRYQCVSDYSDLPVGSLVSQIHTTIRSTSWERHSASVGRQLPHFGAEPFPELLVPVGEITHTHCDHGPFEIAAHEVPSTCVTVMVDGSFNTGSCDFSKTTTSICVFGSC